MRTEKMFRRALRAIGGQRGQRDSSILGGRNVLIPRKPDYPPSRMTRGSGAPTGGSGRRMSAADRRRRNLTILAAFIIVTFVLGLIPPLRFLLVLNLIADVLLIAYLIAAMVFAARAVPNQRTREAPPRVVSSSPEAAGGGL